VDLDRRFLITGSPRPTLRLDSSAPAEGSGQREAGATAQSRDLAIGLLGPVTATVDGAPIDIGGARAETLLALLAMRPGAPVSVDALIDALWSGEPPDGAGTTLRSYASRLRAALGEGATIERVSAGYRLAIEPESVDMTRFESGVREGYELLGRGRYRRATQALRTALGLWRGEPFAGLPDLGPFMAEIARLHELRLHALETRLAADLEVGRASELVDELEGLVAAYPFRERLWRHLMLALYRAGRQGDALAAYHRARRALDEELGIEPGAELRELESAILRQDVAPPSARRTPAISLPAPLTSFIGRDRELAEGGELLARARLVTLVGIGGAGKTRLALELARRASEAVADGVAFVDLAAVTDPELVPATVAAALGLRETPGQEILAALSDHLRGAEILLVLDNSEHLREAVAALAERLLTAASDLRILATSREVLAVPGEAIYPVPPLSLPAAEDDPDAVLRSEAVQLLVDRARLSRHDVRLDTGAFETAARICRDLDGLPLAIELAAARTNALSLDEIADRLQDRFGFLVSSRRHPSARHSALRETMDWSYALLAPEEQELLARLSVFPAGGSLASIAAVCVDGATAEAERRLERLIDASLVLPTEERSGTRYRLLETVRQYAAGQLAPDQIERIRRRHAERTRDLALAANLALEQVASGMSFEPVWEELPSIRAAIRWAIDADPALGVEIACALERFWTTGHGREGSEIFDQLLAQEDLDDLARARALRCRGGARYSSGDFAGGTADYEAAIAIHRRLGQPAYVAHLLLRNGIEAFRQRDLPRARWLLDEAAATGGTDRFVPDRIIELTLAADLAFAAGRVDEGFAMLRDAVEIAERTSDDWWLTNIQLSIADHAVDSGRLALVGPSAREALRLSTKLQDRQSTIWSLAFLALEAALSGRHERAGRIWGGIEAEGERGGRFGQWALSEEGFRTRVAEIGGEAFLAGAAAGRSLPLPDVVGEAISPA
jgi:predicted ATPase/DNA-binding SARP family transcriptional activator